MRVFVRDRVDRTLILKMDSKEKEYPSEFVTAAGKENLLGLRFPKKYGGPQISQKVWRPRSGLGFRNAGC
ncbi:MAG: acyl-CoA dehydrogenase family protein [Candidatus Thorarchaeota archaeon]